MQKRDERNRKGHHLYVKERMKNFDGEMYVILSVMVEELRGKFTVEGCFVKKLFVSLQHEISFQVITASCDCV